MKKVPLDQHRPKLTTAITERDHSVGPADALLTLLEYGDYECPYCGRAFPVVQEIMQRMNGRLRFVFRHFPLNTIHHHASVAAQGAEAAAAQGKFWEMHAMLYGNQEYLETDDLTRYALKIGLEVYKFQSDLSSERYVRKVQDDFRSGVRSGVNKTPTFFINNYRYNGDATVEELLPALKAEE